MLSLEEKKYLAKLLRAEKRRWWRKKTRIHLSLSEKLEQMIRNETVNKDYF